MFDQMKQFGALMKNAGEIKRRAEEMKQELEHRTVDGEAGGGAVRVTMNGHGRVMRVYLDDVLFGALAGDDKAIGEELIASAFNDGSQKLKALVAEEMKKAAGGLDLPGLENLMG